MSAAAGEFAGLGLSLTIILVGLLAGIGFYAIVVDAAAAWVAAGKSRRSNSVFTLRPRLLGGRIALPNMVH
jgi:hypothetical protein